MCYGFTERCAARAAANRLFISQPALSKQIRLLESSLRAVLFDRDRRTVRLTEADEALLPAHGRSSPTGTGRSAW